MRTLLVHKRCLVSAWALVLLPTVVLWTLVLTAVGCAEERALSETGWSAPDSSPAVVEELWQKAWRWERELEADPSLTVCRLSIPRIGLDIGVLQMIDESMLEAGPGHWPETPLPGMEGDFVISGHRTLFGSPFLRLDELEAGDTVKIVLPYAVFEYQVTRKLVVGVTDVQVVASRGLEEISLVTCHPPGSEEYRLVVQAEAVSVEESEQPD